MYNVSTGSKKAAAGECVGCSLFVQIKSHMADPFQSGCCGQMRGPQIYHTILELEEEVEEFWQSCMTICMITSSGS